MSIEPVIRHATHDDLAVIIELDDKWSEHHNVLQGLQSGSKTKVRNKKVNHHQRGSGRGLRILSRFDRMFHSHVNSTGTNMVLKNHNKKDDNEDIISADQDGVYIQH